ncbi:MAG: Uma2 family endonuclease [Chloroflexota bacterium]|nr:Uma2 family endonuclease [Chloroflexota bacterium]
MTLKIKRIERYYDSHEVEEEELTQSFDHFLAIQHLIAVLEWLFHGKTVGVVSNVNFYPSDPKDEKPKSPDIAVVKGLVLEERTSEDNPSYWVGEDGPPPLVAFEVASKETWRNDLETKPESYLKMGIPEYFSFDPNGPSVWTGDWRDENRLIGWQRETIRGEYRKLEKDAAGRLWSEALQSWLIVEGRYLQLYTRDGELRLTEVQAQTQQAALERARADAQTQQAALERARADAQTQRAEAQAQQAALEHAKVEKLLELLRQKGINPDDLI